MLSWGIFFITNIWLSSAVTVHNQRMDLTSVPWYPSNTTKINLSHNRIQTITADDFCYITLLNALELSFNQIEYIDNSSLSCLALSNLRLQGNKLQMLPDLALSKNTLRFLFVADNYIQNISDDYFHGFSNLKSLSLSNNSLKHIPNMTYLS